jgi:hypothetical protein
MENFALLPHRLSAYHRALQVGWSRFRAVLMLTPILPASETRWNGTKVLLGNQSKVRVSKGFLSRDLHAGATVVGLAPSAEHWTPNSASSPWCKSGFVGGKFWGIHRVCS